MIKTWGNGSMNRTKESAGSRSRSLTFDEMAELEARHTVLIGGLAGLRPEAIRLNADRSARRGRTRQASSRARKKK